MPEPTQPPTSESEPTIEEFSRYTLPIREVDDLSHLPSKFKVKVKRLPLAKFLVKEMIRYQNRPHFAEVVTSRPCIFGTFGSPVGGFFPLPRQCVGCLRCMTEHPGMVTVRHNPERLKWGDDFLTPKLVDTIIHESATGAVPVKGQGYRGRMGGPGWDGMWTDMSEIVRPTRDGIHGREYISTVIDIGGRQTFVEFDPNGKLANPPSANLSLPLPILFDQPPRTIRSKALCTILSRAARIADTLALMPLTTILERQLAGNHLVPLLAPGQQDLLSRLDFAPRMVELTEWDQGLIATLRRELPGTIVALRLPFGPGSAEKLLERVEAGVEVVHLTADYHGRDPQGNFVLDLIKQAHDDLVRASLRDTVTLLGSGGIVAAEHVPKAIICGLDGVALNTPLLSALQARPLGQCADPVTSRFKVPRLKVDWGTQRLVNLLGSWRDQLLEIMGAMGLREVRRLRGELGRAMFQAELEKEAFGGIEGYA